MNPWMDAIDRLRSFGYSFTLAGEKLRYTYQGKDNPPHDQITPLLEVIKAHKGQILNDPYFLIEQTLQRINESWEPGTLEWVKREKPEIWPEIRKMEEAISQAALTGNISELKDSLNHYRNLWGRVILGFKENLIPLQTKEVTIATGFKQGRLFSG